MLASTKLGALANVDTDFMRINPCIVCSVWNEVSLPGESRHPEAVVRVRGKQDDVSGCGMIGIAYRNMKFVGCDKSLLRILEFPPKLMPDSDYLRCTLRESGILYRMNHSCAGEEKDHHDKNGNNGPSKLELVAAVNLSRFSPVVATCAAESY